MEQEVLTVPEVAAILRVRTHRVYDLAKQGDLPAVKIGRQVRISRAALQAFIERGGAPLQAARDR